MLHMKYGRKLIQFLSLMLQMFQCSDPFSDAELEHIRNLFCEYLYDLTLKKSDQDNNEWCPKFICKYIL